MHAKIATFATPELTSFTLFRQMYKLGKRHFIPFVATINAVLFTNLIAGIMIGGT
ncbi:hypothetical protein HRH25_01500 [Flavisolibacter sp. BT320]|nr:hypothetical protein [Flavisolibacter longurius]